MAAATAVIVRWPADTSLGEFLLLYDEVARFGSPGETLLDFCQATYEAGAVLGRWDRQNLEPRVSAKRAS